MSPQLLAVLHVEDVEGGHVNLRGRRNPLDVYLKNAITLHKSLATQGWRLRILSDAGEMLTRRAATYGLHADALPVIETFPFTLDVPAGIRFRGAHFRFEVFDAIARGEFGKETGLIDVDCVAVGALPPIPLTAPGELLCFQMDWGEGGWRRHGADVARLAGFLPTRTLWFGGEFLYGRAETFGLLARRFREIWPIYAVDPSSFQYVGMEMVLTALLHSTPGVTPISSTDRGLLARWWSHRTVGAQPSLEEIVSRTAILHLLGDKVFLEGEANHPFARDTFLGRYRRYMRGRIALSHLSNWTAPLNRGGVKHVPRIS